MSVEIGMLDDELISDEVSNDSDSEEEDDYFRESESESERSERVIGMLDDGSISDAVSNDSEGEDDYFSECESESEGKRNPRRLFDIAGKKVLYLLTEGSQEGFNPSDEDLDAVLRLGRILPI